MYVCLRMNVFSQDTDSYYNVPEIVVRLKLLATLNFIFFPKNEGERGMFGDLKLRTYNV